MDWRRRGNLSTHSFRTSLGATEAEIEPACDTNTSYGTTAHNLSALPMMSIQS